MSTRIESKHASVARAPYLLYMLFVDMRNFVQYLPEDRREGITADYDSIRATVQGFDIGVRVDERVPYSKVSFKDDGAPFSFRIDVHFDADPAYPEHTDFYVDVDADLNFMMKMLLGGKIKEALDKMVDSLAALSEGRMPEGVDPSMFPEGFDFSNPMSGYKKEDGNPFS